MTGYKEPPKEYQWKKGQSGNAGGRPKGSVKDYLKVKLSEMTPKEKDEWLKNMPKDLQWRMAEGNPANNTDITSGGEKITFVPSELSDKYTLNETNKDTDTSSSDSS